MFGADFATHVEETHTPIPHLVQKCVEEINKRGLDVKVSDALNCCFILTNIHIFMQIEPDSIIFLVSFH